jgi:hypothetical protein
MGKHVPVIFLTQKAREARLKKALREIEQSDVADETATVMLRIEDFA